FRCIDIVDASQLHGGGGTTGAQERGDAVLGVDVLVRACAVGPIKGAGGETESVVKVGLLDEREDVDVPAQLIGEFPCLGKAAVGVVVVVQGQTELLEVIGTLDSGGGLADFLRGRQQESNENGNDGDHHQ